MTADQPLLHAALAYAARGFRILPLHHPLQLSNPTKPGGVGCSCGDPGCGPAGKHPRTRNGLHEATTDLARLARWWQRWPQANIGLVTGELADVLDLDGPTGQAALRRWATHHHHHRLDGPLVRTGSGWHRYLAATGAGNRTGLLDHVDRRGHGGYVVAPPSRHACGARYRWLRPLTGDLHPPRDRCGTCLTQSTSSSRKRCRGSARYPVTTPMGARPSSGNSPPSPRRHGVAATTPSTRCHPPVQPGRRRRPGP